MTLFVASHGPARQWGSTLGTRNLVIALIVGTIGCGVNGDPMPHSTSMAMMFVPDDFHTDVLLIPPALHDEWVGVLGVRWEGFLETSMVPTANDFFRDRIALVSLATGAPVAGAVRSGIMPVDGETPELPGINNFRGAYSFIPESPLAMGWYVLVVDTRGWSETIPSFVFGRGLLDEVATEDGFYFRRVHVGSRPTWYLSIVQCEDESGDNSCRVGPVWSERVETLGSTSFMLSVDGHDCGTLDAGDLGGGWLCPHVGEGTRFEISMPTEGTVRRLSAAASSQTIVGGGLSQLRVPVDMTFGVSTARSAL